MTKRKNFRAAVAVLTLLLAAALCFSVLRVYCGGLARRAASGSAAVPVYDRESLKTALMINALPVFAVWLIAAVWAAAAGAGRDKAPQMRGPVKSVRGKDDSWGRQVPAVRSVLLLAAAVLIILGILNGGLRDVLVKAVNICTECIGLG